MNKEEYPIEEELEEFMQLSNKLQQENKRLQVRIDKAINFVYECIENETNCSQSFEYIETDNEIKEIHKYFIDSEIMLKILKGEKQ